ncbi:MAG TPA: hypothetical protein VLL31_05645 [Sulfurovum sp.]|nr:hypothetical protein [Sulfurovum sp.]
MEILSILVLLVVILFIMVSQNNKLREENKKLNEILEVKNATISNYEASRVAVKDVMENFSMLDEVMTLIDAGESREAVAEKLGIPVSKVELIIKFDKLKKRD